ncbi:zinc/manganese transport system ATP-binding protein [Mycolicibacterium rutilum]|uniref:Zinc/manganese transport system ATP-binding protein n=1 Tax=Mycolicibacterium rutilum TaxID=370526 RepID=A0A1H6JPZ6_MYCRU|nr:zinc ABC transporter ATP-binding protein AztA [Mycolicibacterium rutilum]SEH61263.1 zinc/manganese transport system ATP-binding protein [Mycolicibacterium rutilum]
MNDAIHVDGVGFGYNETRVLDGLTLHIPGGATTAVVGANGSGKSTLLGLLAGTLFPQQGSIDAPRADGVAFAVQHSQVSDALPITVAETVMMGRWRALGLWRRPSREDRAIVDYWITELGLDDLRRRRLGTLSGGQRQRTLLAQAFAQESPVVLLDEPTVGLDADSRDRVARQIVRLAASGRTIVAATHDVGLAGRFDFCVLLGAGSVLATGSPEAIFTEPNLAAALSLG